MIIKVFIVAGEASGDNLGGKLMRQLRLLYGDCKFVFSGIGGSKMAEQGLDSLVPLENLAVMGYWEVLTSIPRIWRAMRLAEQKALEFRPNVVLTIDSPGFNFRLVKRLRRNFADADAIVPKFLHYVSPSVWAYRYKRIFTVQKLFDHILLLLPFEKQYYDAINFPSTYVGHPVVEDCIVKCDNIKPKQDIIIVMPGSRLGELQRHLPVFKEVMQRLPEVFFVLPMVKAHCEYVKNYFADMPNIWVGDNADEISNLAALAKIAIVKSGTSSVEIMHKRIPMIVGYRVAKITELLLRYVFRLKITYVTLCNLICKAPIIPEFLQKNFTADNLYNAAVELLTEPAACKKQLDAFDNVLKQLGDRDAQQPSQKAARAVGEAIGL